MPIDASIVRGLQPVQVESPVNRMAQVLQIKGMQDEQALNSLKAQEYQRGVAAENALNDAYKGALGADGSVDRNRMYQTLAGGGYGSKIPGLQKQFMEIDAKQADIGKTKAEGEAKALEAATKRVDAWGQVMGYVRQNPTAENAIGAVQHLVNMGIIPPDKAQTALDGVANDPQSIANWATRGFQASLKVKDQLPTFQTRNTGGTTDTIGIDPVTGQAKVVNSVQNTQSPDNIATNARVAADNAASRAQAERHFQAGESAPQYMQTDAGLVALPKKPVPGQAPTGTLVMGPDGQPLTKPLKDIPPAQNAAIIENTKALQNIDAAIAAIKANPNALGAQNYLPEGVTQRTDPKGVDVRSKIANIAGQRFHELSGAAVSVGEAERLKPFIPSDKDTAETAVRKLENLKREYMGVNDMLSTTYSKDQGYKPSPVKPPVQKPSVTNW